MELEKLFLLQTFAMAYHWRNSGFALVEDRESNIMLGEDEYSRIENNVLKLAVQLYPNTYEKSAIKQFMNKFICPLPVANHIFSYNSIKNAAMIGTSQLIMVHQGYSTLPYHFKNERITAFDINTPVVALNKRKMTSTLSARVRTRLADNLEDSMTILSKHNGYSEKAISIITLGCIPLFIEKERFKNFLTSLNDKLSSGSSVVFCYGDENFTSADCDESAIFAKELVKRDCYAGYTYEEMEKLLSQRGFLIYEHLTRDDMQKQYFDQHNIINHSDLSATGNISYILAVKKEKKN